MESTEALARRLLELMGGSENVQSITHCATRLRPQFKDRNLVQKKDIQELDGVTGIVDKDSGFQIVIGTNVGEVYDAFIKYLDSTSTSEDLKTETKERHLLNDFVALVVSIFSPLLPLLAGSGLLRGFTILANELGWLSTESTTNLMLTLAATSVFYFLPLLVAVTSANRFKTSPYIAVAILGALIMPDFINLIQGDGGNLIRFFGISMPVFNSGDSDCVVTICFGTLHEEKIAE